jgi:hypothetical protein
MAAPTAGLAVDANTNAALTTATFTSVTLTGQWAQKTAADFGTGTSSGTLVTATGGGAVQLASGSLSGIFTSAIFDAARIVAWGKASWTAAAPAGTTLVVETRSGNAATPDSSWSAWAATTNGQSVSSPAGRYFQYRVKFTSTSATATSVFSNFAVLWS